MKKQLLFSQTISNLHPYVAAQIQNEYQHHRTPWMENKLKSITKFFHATIGKTYTPLILTCTHDGAHEAILANVISAGDAVLTQENTSWEIIADRLGANITLFNPLSTNLLPSLQPTLICINDTLMDGTRVNLASLSKKLRKKYPKALIVAAIATSFGADTLDFSKNDVDGYIIVPERALGGIPGLTVTALNNKIFTAIENIRKTNSRIPYTFDLLKYRTAWKKYSTPYSPDVSASVGLSAAIIAIEKNGGLTKHVNRHAKWSAVFRKNLNALGCTVLPQHSKKTSNAFTICTIPTKYSTSQILSSLQKKGIAVDTYQGAKQTLCIGHTGYLTQKYIEQFFDAFETVITPPKKYTRINIRDTWAPVQTEEENIPKDTFSIPKEEFLKQILKKSEQNKSSAMKHKLSISGNMVFNAPDTLENYCYKERTVGFIGAGNIVREAVTCLQKLGVKNISVYSPSLARLKKKKLQGNDIQNHKTLAYWKHRGVHVATSAKEIFLNSHTVVLQPTFYNKEALALFKKKPEYFNENMVNMTLLSEVEKKGKMDLLLNMSGRDGLIDRTALAHHLKKEWLTFFSDETPREVDPVSCIADTVITGHIAGSTQQAQRAVANNTHTILQQVIQQISTGKPLQKTAPNGYQVNVINAHLYKKTQWRAERQADQKVTEIRVLITDKFDLETLDFPALEKMGAIKINVLNTSEVKPTEKTLARDIQSFKPHILMVRTRTLITNTIGTIIANTPEFCAIVRPGVGVDSIYAGMQTVSTAGVQIINEPSGNSKSVGEMVAHMTIRSIKNMILTPGPTKYNPDVFRVISEYSHPSSKVFLDTEKAVREKLRPWIGLAHGPVLLSAPSTGFMEASITNLTSVDDKGLIIAHGKFGNRFKEISIASKRTVTMLEVSDKTWGTAYTPKDVQAILIANKKKGEKPFTYLCLQQNETSTGVSYKQKHLETIIRMVRAYNPNILIILDGVSGIFAHAIEIKKLALDVVVLGSQKGLGVSSGLSYASLSNRAVEQLLKHAGYTGSWKTFVTDPKRYTYLKAFEKKQQVYYLNFLQLLLNTHEGQTAHTPSIFHILSTDASLSLIKKEGIENVKNRSLELAKLTRSLARALNLKLLAHEPFISNSVTPILLPKKIKAPELRKQMEQQYGILISGAQSDYWKPSLVRVGHVGYVYRKDITRCMRALTVLLKKK